MSTDDDLGTTANASRTNAVAAREFADRRPIGLVDADRDEVGQVGPLGFEPTECVVLGVDQVDGRLDEPMQDDPRGRGPTRR